MGSRDARALRFERAGGDDDLVQDAQVLGFEAAALRGSESLIWKIEGREGLQGLAHAGKLLRELHGQRAKRG